MKREPTFKKLILDDLKAQGRKDIADKIRRIRYSSFAGGDAVDVYAVDLFKNEREFLSKLLKEYEPGYFDGMTDCYYYNTEKSTKPRTAKYVHLHHEFSETIKDIIKERLEARWDIIDDESAQKRRQLWYDQAVWMDCNALKGEPKEMAEVA